MVGQEHITTILQAQAQQGKFSSSYLLYWPRWTWKTTTARIIAKLVNIAVPWDTAVPDLSNHPVSAIIDDGKSLDYVEIDAASHTWVDNIREEILDKALYPPTTLKTKVYVIDEVHMLSKWAFNALLKIMEEPNTYLKFILATTEIQKVPDTIISRCQVFNFKHIQLENLVDRLAFIAQEEQITYEKEALYLIARLANGWMRDAIKYLEQVSILWAITQESVSQFLWVVSAQDLALLIEALRTESYTQFIDKLDQLVEWGVDLYSLIKDLLLYCDEHFDSAPDFYSILVWILQEIAAEMKWYPHPLLIWKKKFYHFFLTSWAVQSLSAQKNPDATSNSGHQKDLDGLHATAWSVQESSSAKNNIKKENVDHNTQQIDQDVTSVKSTSNTTTKQETGENKSSERDIVDTQHTTFQWTMDELKLQIVARLEKIMLKSAIKQHTILQSLKDGVISMIVLNEQFYALLQKHDTLWLLETIASEITWSPVQIAVTYMSKESFLSA